MDQIRFIITGTVQGVGYRQFALREGNRLGLTGFVRNLSDGSVECVARGESGQLEQLEARLRKGPPYSQVDSVQSAPSNAQIQPGFRVL